LGYITFKAFIFVPSVQDSIIPMLKQVQSREAGVIMGMMGILHGVRKWCGLIRTEMC
jgi:hypothetical protein